MMLEEDEQEGGRVNARIKASINLETSADTTGLC